MARVILERDVPCPMRDGILLASDVWRPDDDERHPVLLQRTPYDKTFYPFTWPQVDPTKMAAAGYVVVIQDVRGRFASQGEWPGPFVSEAEDGFDAIAWAASQPWSDGTVGTYGVSYMGGVQWLTATERPPALRAIAPATSPNDVHEQHWFRGGALQLGLMVAWTVASVGPHAVARRLAGTPELGEEFLGLVADMDALDAWCRRVPLVPFPPIDERAGGFAPWWDETVSAEVRGPQHDAVSTSRRHADIRVPALQIAGWYDVLLQPELDHFTSMKSEAGSEDARRLTRLVVGPWAHAAFLPVVGEVDFGFRASQFLLDLREDFTSLHRRWFDARLRGVDSGIDDEPPVKLFVMGANRWRSEDTWPPARAQVRRWHLHGGGGLSPRPPEPSGPSTFTLDPEDPVPTHGGTILMHTKHMRGPRDQAPVEARPDVLLFTSEPLERDLEVTGRVRLVAHVATETVDSDVVARLCDVSPDGRSINVVDGIQRLRFRNGPTDPQPVTPGETVSVEVDLWSTSYLFRAGHRLRLHVCASDFPRYDRCPGSGEGTATAKRILPQRNTLFHDPERPSYLELPEVS